MFKRLRSRLLARLARALAPHLNETFAQATKADFDRLWQAARLRDLRRR